VRLAKEQGRSLTGPDGLLKQLTNTVLETSLNEELTEHLAMRSTTPLRRRPTSVTGPAPRRC
jgi:putative transposase